MHLSEVLHSSLLVSHFLVSTISRQYLTAFPTPLFFVWHSFFCLSVPSSSAQFTLISSLPPRIRLFIALLSSPLLCCFALFRSLPLSSPLFSAASARSATPSSPSRSQSPDSRSDSPNGRAPSSQSTVGARDHAVSSLELTANHLRRFTIPPRTVSIVSFIFYSADVGCYASTFTLQVFHPVKADYGPFMLKVREKQK